MNLDISSPLNVCYGTQLMFPTSCHNFCLANKNEGSAKILILNVREKFSE